MPPAIIAALVAGGVAASAAGAGAAAGANDRDQAFNFNNASAQDLADYYKNAQTEGHLNIDPTGRNSTLSALRDMQNVVANKGLTPEDMANIYNIQNKVQQTDRGATNAAMQNAQMRGMGNSPLGFLGSLTGIQGGAQQGEEMGVNTAAQAQQRALQAMQQEYGMGSGIRGADTGQAEFNTGIDEFNFGRMDQAAQMRAQADREKALNYAQRAGFTNQAFNNVGNAFAQGAASGSSMYGGAGGGGMGGGGGGG